MQDSQQRMIETQARQITNQANKFMEQLTKCQSQAAMYNLIEELVGEHPNLADNWSDFLMMLKMVEEGVEDRFKKLMVPDYVPYVLPEDKLT
jgi:hypothetical protein